jgi:hypothetical protein
MVQGARGLTKIINEKKGTQGVELSAYECLNLVKQGNIVAKSLATFSLEALRKIAM